MPAKRCPQCGLVNPSSASRCDCGRFFGDAMPTAPVRARSGVRPIVMMAFVVMAVAAFAAAMYDAIWRPGHHALTTVWLIASGVLATIAVVLRGRG